MMGKLSETIRLRTAKGQIDPGTGLIAKTVFIKAPRSLNMEMWQKLIDRCEGVRASPVGLQVDELDEK